MAGKSRDMSHHMNPGELQVHSMAEREDLTHVAVMA